MHFMMELPQLASVVQVHPSWTAAAQLGVAHVRDVALHAWPVGHTVHVEQLPPLVAVAFPACLQTPPQQVPRSQFAVVVHARVLQ
jgi:hypothetical protein